MITLGAAAVAVGGVLGGAYVTHAAAKISLSASSMSAEHHRHNGMGNGMMPTPMASSSMGGMSSGGMNGGGMNTAGMSGNAMNGSSMTGGMMTGRFSTFDNTADPTFNQLLGINNRGLIAGYFGSGAQGHPNKGYLLSLRNNMPLFQAENFPNSVQTQVTGLNDRGVTVGFYSTMNTASMTNNNFGFYSWRGSFHSVNFPTPHNANPPVNQLLGVNDFGVAVGFYTDTAGNTHGLLVLGRHHHMRVMMPAPTMSPSMMGSTPGMTPTGAPMNTPAPMGTSIGHHT